MTRYRSRIAAVSVMAISFEMGCASTGKLIPRRSHLRYIDERDHEYS